LSTYPKDAGALQAATWVNEQKARLEYAYQTVTKSQSDVER